MTLHRLIQFFGPLAYLASICTVLAYVTSEWMSGWFPLVADLLDGRPGLTAAISISFFFAGVYFTPPSDYKSMNRWTIQHRRRTPLSRLFARPAYMICTEVLALLFAATLSVTTVVFAFRRILTREDGTPSSEITKWAIFIGLYFSFVSLLSLRRYIFAQDVSFRFFPDLSFLRNVVTIHRIVQLLAPAAYFAWMGLVFVYVKFDKVTDSTPQLIQRLHAKPELTLGVILCLAAVGLYLRQPDGYGLLAPAERQWLDRTPLSRQFGRPAYSIALEVLALVIAAVVSVATVIWAFVYTFTRDTSAGVTAVPGWAIAIGCIFSHLSLRALRRYIYPSRMV